MSSAYFPINDLTRRRLQTVLIIVTLTLVVSSTLSLLLFSERLGFGITISVGTLTRGLSTVFGQFVLFLAFLIFAIGAVITSFVVFLMMKQRMRDFGLMKAIGCPNGLVFSYFLTELLIVTVVGCVLGVIFGLAADFTITNAFRFSVYQKPPNYWFAPLVFFSFFSLSIVFGIRPLLDAARLSPLKALSPVQYFSLGAVNKFRPISKSGLILRISSRSLFRRGAATVRIIVLLSIVFVLLTVSISGGIIAGDTTKSWVAKAVGIDNVLIAHKNMGDQYILLLSQFFGEYGNSTFAYSDREFALPEEILQGLDAIDGIIDVDARLVLMEHVQELSSYRIDPETLATISVGDNRISDVLVVGVDPERIATESVTKGQFLNSSSDWNAVIGDTVMDTMYVPDRSKKISVSDPFIQGMKIRDNSFKIIGVCVDPVNNGNVTYVPLKNLQNVTGIFNPNILLVKIDSSIDRTEKLKSLKTFVENVDPNFSVFDLNDVLNRDVQFLESTWSIIMLLPLLTLISASLCLVSFMMLTADEMRQEFAILRAVGAKPNTIVAVLTVQSVIVLLSSFVAGISFGIITTLLILVPNPVVTTGTIAEVAAWLFTALFLLLLSSLYPSLKLAKTPILRIIT
jgi:ABC-type antimicrobial peptide transport system permease subunit